MPKYSTIAIIYNPNSTGPGKNMATELYEQLLTVFPKIPVDLIATKRAGHAEELTYDLAMKYERPLIVSVSGDGGYNEVINGAAKAYEAGRSPITGLLPAGNANDHHASVGHNNLLKTIQAGKTTQIDMLLISASDSTMTMQRRAHSYIGFGMTPRIGKKLTEANLNRFKETTIVLRSLFKSKVTRLSINGEVEAYDSITISNIERMAKVLKLGKSSRVDDGLFEVNIVRHKAMFALFGFLLKAVTAGIADAAQTESFELKTVTETLVQTDGEVFTLPANAEVRITIDKHSLHCIV